FEGTREIADRGQNHWQKSCLEPDRNVDAEPWSHSTTGQPNHNQNIRSHESKKMSDMNTNHADIDVFIGIDVGKHNHHAVAVDRNGKQLLSKALPQNETKLKALLTRLAQHAQLLVIADQPATSGALPVAVAQAAGITVAYLPGLAMRRIADLHPGEAKTDARDAAIIAEAARTMPHTLRGIRVADENVAELSMLCSYDTDLAK